MLRSSEKLNSGSQGDWEPAANQAETHFREVRPHFCLHWLSLLQFLTPLLLKWQLQQEDLEVKRLGNFVSIPKISPELCHVILGHNWLEGFPPPANSCCTSMSENKQKTSFVPSLLWQKQFSVYKTAGVCSFIHSYQWRGCRTSKTEMTWRELSLINLAQHKHVICI